MAKNNPGFNWPLHDISSEFLDVSAIKWVNLSTLWLIYQFFKSINCKTSRNCKWDLMLKIRRWLHQLNDKIYWSLVI